MHVDIIKEEIDCNIYVYCWWNICDSCLRSKLLKFKQRKILFILNCESAVSKLIIKLSFKLTFWTWIEIKLSCSHFQLDLSWVAHIFNLTWLDLTENWVNLTWFVKNLSLTSRKLNIENFPIFNFCITFLHYLLIESHKEKHEDHLIESHKEKHEESHDKKHEEKHEEKHDEKHEEKIWRSFDFDRKSWRKNMIESHEENHEDCSIKLFTFI